MKPVPAFRANDLLKRYGGRTVLAVDHLEVEPGEVLCLVGPTGAGKSTLLRLLAGLEQPDGGEVWFGPSRLDGGQGTDLVRQITLVFQRPLLLSGTVRANVEYGPRLRRQRDRAHRAQEVLTRLGLGSLASQAARTLSGGETQLVALARALVLETPALLLDEPTANLDPARVALVEAVVAERRRRLGTTVVWATHNLFQARRVANRVALLLDGRLVEVAPVEPFFERPADPRTAAFVQGKMVY